VYKLSAIRSRSEDAWQYKMKLSEQLAKVSPPGILQVRRFRRENGYIADLIYNLPDGITPPPTLVDPKDSTRRRTIDPTTPSEDLLVPVFRGGRCVYTSPAIGAIRQRATEQVSRLHPTVRRLLNPHEYPVGLDSGLAQLRAQLLQQGRGALHHPEPDRLFL
jgi:nicotinate phosphoribosyltransferase